MKDRSSCPSEDEIVAYLNGERAGRAEMEAHFDACPACAMLIMELGALSGFHSAHSREATAPSSSMQGGPELATGASALPPVFLDRYELGEILGFGGMGMVMAAWDRTLERRVAIKILRPDHADSPHRAQLTARMLQEARALARLSHPGVLTIFEVGAHEDRLYMVTELLVGETFATLGPRDEETALERFTGVLEALAHAHAAGIVHRDIKPSNIILSNGEPVLIDFGLATSGSSRGTDLTATGAVMGTPTYMSPEQHMGKEVGPASDVFSVCVALYECAYGRRPFDGDTASELAMRAYAGELVKPEVVKNTALFAVLREGLDADPARRPSDASALLERLNRIHRPARSTRFVKVILVIVALVAIAAIAWSVELIARAPAHRSGSDITATARHDEARARTSRLRRVHEQTTRRVMHALEVASQRARLERARARTVKQRVVNQRAEASSARAGGAVGDLIKKQRARRHSRAEVIKLSMQAELHALTHETERCEQTSRGLDPDELIVKRARGHCLMIRGRCDEGEELIRAYYASLPDGVLEQTVNGLRTRLCKPPARDALGHVKWEVEAFAAASVPGVAKERCVPTAKRALEAASGYDAIAKGTKEERYAIAAKLDAAQFCFGSDTPETCALRRSVYAESERWRAPGASPAKHAERAEQLMWRFEGCAREP